MENDAQIKVSVASRLRDVKAVLQHLVARHHIAFDRQDDRELRRDDVAGRLDPSLERANDRGAAIAGENVVPVGNLIRLASEAESRNVSAL